MGAIVVETFNEDLRFKKTPYKVQLVKEAFADNKLHQGVGHPAPSGKKWLRIVFYKKGKRQTRHILIPDKASKAVVDMYAKRLWDNIRLTEGL